MVIFHWHWLQSPQFSRRFVGQVFCSLQWATWPAQMSFRSTISLFLRRLCCQLRLKIQYFQIPRFLSWPRPQLQTYVATPLAIWRVWWLPPLFSHMNSACARQALVKSLWLIEGTCLSHSNPQLLSWHSLPGAGNILVGQLGRFACPCCSQLGLDAPS